MPVLEDIANRKVQYAVYWSTLYNTMNDTYRHIHLVICVCPYFTILYVCVDRQLLALPFTLDISKQSTRALVGSTILREPSFNFAIHMLPQIPDKFQRYYAFRGKLNLNSTQHCQVNITMSSLSKCAFHVLHAFFNWIFSCRCCVCALLSLHSSTSFTS